MPGSRGASKGGVYGPTLPEEWRLNKAKAALIVALRRERATRPIPEAPAAEENDSEGLPAIQENVEGGADCLPVVPQPSMAFGAKDSTVAHKASNAISVHRSMLSAASAPSAMTEDSNFVPLNDQEFQEEVRKGLSAILLVLGFFCCGIAMLFVSKSSFKDPTCPRSYEEVSQLRSCEVCGRGTLLLPLGGEMEKQWPPAMLVILYLLGLLWCFVGIAIISDEFMAAIERISTAEVVRWRKGHGNAFHKKVHRVWNPTLANLTLMALGSSAPEILLSIVELLGNEFFAGELGPSTIVGSAAFNLLVITAVCVSAIAAPEVRRIEHLEVFAVTSISSILAYVWLYLMLEVITPDIINLWEGLLTLLMFPLLLVTAYAADRGKFDNITALLWSQNASPELRQEQKQLEVLYGHDVSLATVKIIRKQLAAEASDRKTIMRSASMQRAAYRHNFVSSMSRGGSTRSFLGQELTFGFRHTTHFILPFASSVKVPVVASRDCEVPVHLRYRTLNGNCPLPLKYVVSEGTITFQPHEMEQVIDIPIQDPKSWGPNDEFYVELNDMSQGRPVHRILRSDSNRSNRPRIGLSGTTIKLLNDSEPGHLAFECVNVRIARDSATVIVGVLRLNGSHGKIWCRFCTVDDSAVRGKDYVHSEGTVEFRSGQTEALIHIELLHPEAEELRTFRVVLSDPSPGVRFKYTSPTDRSSSIGPTRSIGGGHSNIELACQVMIVTEATASCKSVAARRSLMSKSLLDKWREKAIQTFFCNGGPELQKAASKMDWLLHILSLFWKGIFVLVPPTDLWSGWATFFSALAMVGIVTAITSDIASLLGCTIGMPDGITAITLVALGTSLPDTFASMTAASKEMTADNSIGNITGSNCVNVFLGLGITWTIGSVYWQSSGQTTKWKQRVHKGMTYEERFGALYPDGVLVVPAGSLTFCVAAFMIVALLCLALLMFRRKRYGGELGGPRVAQWRDTSLLLFLWVSFSVSYIIFAVGE